MINIITYRSLFRRYIIAGIAGVFLPLLFTSCRQPKTFADTLLTVEPNGIVALSKEHIDSVAMNCPENLIKEIRDICDALYARGFYDAAIDIAVYPYGIDPEQYPNIAKRLLTSTLLPGKPAPEIVGATPAKRGDKYTLVFFYGSHCRTCQTMIDNMIAEYEGFRRNGVRVITISNDTDKGLFVDYSAKFPWEDKLCDFRGYDSPNFINYGVGGTPVTFLIDGKGKVVDQYGSPDEIYGVLFD